MDGLLIVDKPSGPTSHDIVARARRVLRERRIGHTGTLDPMASGVLPLVVGRATRLARFMGGDKTYEAALRLGVNTDSCDALGEPVGPRFEGPWPDRIRVDVALNRFRGTFLQQPPVYSAKKIGGQRSYALARRGKARDRAIGAGVEAAAESALPAPVSVTAHEIDIMDVSGDRVALRVRCSAGFYIRSLAHDLGAALGTGAHLVELRRIEAAGFGIGAAITLDDLLAPGGDTLAEAALVPMARMLGALPAVALTPDGVVHVRVGRDLSAADASRGFADAVTAAGRTPPTAVCLLDPAGELVAMAEAAPSSGLLHPAVVLL
jgi:tRNA pseudouridine55 synthase